MASIGKRICVVTGSNKGIGYGVVKQMCKEFDGIVYLTSRDENNGNNAVKSLKEMGLSPEYHQLDINDENSIKKLALDLKEKHGGLDVLINNAAIAYKRLSTAPIGEQAENTIETNYFCTSNMFKILNPILRPHARVVNVASETGTLKYAVCGHEPKASELRQRLSSPALSLEDLDSLMTDFIRLAKEGKHKEEGWGSSTYGISKAGVVALTRIQQRMLSSDSRQDVVVNCCCPGYVNTDMTSHKGPKTIEEGAINPCFLAMLPPNISEPKGEFFKSGKILVDWAGGEKSILVGV